jgi:heptosyltransferase-2
VYKRILIVRTDRIGDVLLTTPVIKALRDNLPTAYIVIMVNPSALDIVKDNPYLDEVIVYDKENLHRGIWRNFKFILDLRRKKFDLALVLHTKNRTNIICWLSGIKNRVGYYNKKFGFLLTKKLEDTRPEGKKHEVDYCLDVVRAIGIEPKDRGLFMPKDEVWLQNFLRENNISDGDRLVCIHPGASCISKRWFADRFAQVSDILIEKYNVKILVICGEDNISYSKEMISKMRNRVLDLSGKISLRQLASLLSRCSLLISNDSGPVHISTAVGCPVISIFGRNQKGLSPIRWRPLGKKDVVLHKEVGCIDCLAHNCQKNFACLRAITVADVLEAVDSVLFK